MLRCFQLKKFKMKHVALFIILISSLDCAMAAEEPGVYVQVTWDMAWRRLCHFIPFFAEKLAEELYETKVLVPYDVKPIRIRFMNTESNCKDKGKDDDAILDFFVSKSEKDLGTGDVDRDITILAYKILHDYWRNKKMALLDAVFIGKVNKVELMGKDKPLIPEGITESTRVGIGIAIGLVIISLIAGISLLVNLKRRIKKPPHGVPLGGLPLHVIDIETPEPTFRTEEPPAYDLDRRDGFERRNGSDNGYPVRNMAYQGEESYNSYPVRNMAYDDEPLGSPML